MVVKLQMEEGGVVDYWIGVKWETAIRNLCV